ncbi:carboxylesterase family protein [Myroides pelagicus]|uniref:Prolyl oligopeptidase family serine peptidase n=1 Tax=Myroides pelagicus TaxID=270914 RepID=A0A7K1GIY2_9FLAO|nr:prolyl oligopeptidase family serine peptidase [Myroides pelagicus]MEC4114129.1 prolyl oligopeptidase family serine peptidase [Myroides pelagicus]MTH28489.1 prolyl oligopeptidase family serine peptidase [Myroides pelagicus]
MRLLILLSCVIPLFSIAQPRAILDKTTYSFWLNEPKIVEGVNPLIIFLHGKSLSGTNIDRVKRYGPLKGVEKGLDIPAYLVAPQLPSGPWNADKIDEIVSYMIDNYNIDERRIYVTGMSLGGYGTMKYVGKYPSRVAAAIALCGGGESADACASTTVPIKLIHGDKDFIVPLSESKKIMRAIQACDIGAPIELEVVKGGTHGSVEDLYRHIELYHWLLAHQKE